MNINIIEIDGKEYELCLNRKAVLIAESAGLGPDTMEKRPLYTMTLLWRASFLPKYPEITDEMASDLLDKFEEQHPEQVGKVIKELVSKYASFFEALSIGE